jgi:endonuclease YncB( thermonuclease family)
LAKPRLKDEWKLWVFVGVIAVALVAYLYFVSRPPMEGGEYLWQVKSVSENGDLTLKGSGKTIELKLAALDIPKSQAKGVQEMLTGVLKNKWVRIKTTKEDAKGVAEGFVYLEGEDMHSRIIRQGLGRIKKDDKNLDVRHYMELELEAKKGKKGLWALSAEGGK